MIAWVIASLRHHRRIHLAVALGVATATAVLTGALLVGDSVRGSLRDLTRERLGKIDALLALDRFFRRELATELGENPDFRASGGTATAAILFPQATLEHRNAERTQRASSVLIMGADPTFWELDVSGVRPEHLPGSREVVLNDSLAAELGAAVGDEITLRLPKASQVPADSPLANKNDRVASLPGLKVVAIIPARGLGRFSLQASQSVPWNAFVSIDTLQEALDQPGLINAILVGGLRESQRPTMDQLAGWLTPQLSDFGVEVREVTRMVALNGQPPQPQSNYFSLTTPRMIFNPETAAAIEKSVGPLGGLPVLTYLANSLEPASAPLPKTSTAAPPPGPAPQEAAAGSAPVRKLRPEIPYSMVTALDFGSGFQPLDPSGQPIGPLADQEVVLNSWTADSLGVRPGDRLRVKYFEPETTHGAAVERAEEFVLKAITPLVRPAKPYQRERVAEFQELPAVANDPALTPEVKGVTDQETIDDWDAPFPFDYQRVKDEDEAYWDEYRTTPKAFFSTKTGRRLWGNRFGLVTSFRVPLAERLTVERLRERLAADLAHQSRDLGFVFQDIRQKQLAASSGTTPFDVLFLSLSSFVIAAALFLVALMFQLGVEERARELGTLLAVGYPRRLVGRMFVAEGVAVAGVGAAIGVLVGIAYAKAMLWGLSTWWLDAIASPFVAFHWTARSLVIGYVAGIGATALTIASRIRRSRDVSVRSLLAGVATAPRELSGGPRRKWANRRWPAALLLVALGLAGWASQLGGMAQAGAFVGAGAMFLTGLLLLVRHRLAGQAQTERPAWNRGWLLWGIAERNTTRNPGRSLMTIALMASATFLIVAMSSFRLAPTENGVGGFEFLASSSEPIYDDLNDPARRDEYFGTQASTLEGSSLFAFRVRPGDDASCQNLYQSAQPRVLGVSPAFVQRFEDPQAIPFSWAGSAAATPEERRNPWRLLLDQPASSSATEPVPVVLDKNTALYSLKLYRGVGEEFSFDYGGTSVRFRVAGFLENSVLQGSLLISDANFRRHFPQLSGFRFFLVATPRDKGTAVVELLEERFSDQGLDATASREVLSHLLGVQNAYLSTFQSLGGLGLLLGAVGLAAVQLRNILERRGELALQRAVGYPRSMLARLVLLESVVLLVSGLATGLVSALLAVLPHKLLGSAAFSWLLLRDLGVMLGVVLLVGLAASYWSVRAVSRLSVVGALRGE